MEPVIAGSGGEGELGVLVNVAIRLAGGRYLLTGIGMLPIANPVVVYRALSEGAVLFSTTDEVYFGLNNVGAKAWELLPPTTNTLDDLCAALVKEYPEVPEATIRADVNELLEELTAHGLVVPREASAPPAEERKTGARYNPEAGGARLSRAG